MVTKIMKVEKQPKKRWIEVVEENIKKGLERKLAKESNSGSAAAKNS